MNKQTVINGLAIDREGRISVSLSKEIVEDDGHIIAAGHHNFVLEPGEDIDARMEMISQSLVRDQKCAPVELTETAHLKDVASAVWTPEVIAAFQAAQAAADEAMGQRQAG